MQLTKPVLSALRGQKPPVGRPAMQAARPRPMLPAKRPLGGAMAGIGRTR